MASSTFSKRVTGVIMDSITPDMISEIESTLGRRLSPLQRAVLRTKIGGMLVAFFCLILEMLNDEESELLEGDAAVQAMHKEEENLRGTL